jgi:hypothetical protein
VIVAMVQWSGWILRPCCRAEFLSGVLVFKPFLVGKSEASYLSRFGWAEGMCTAGSIVKSGNSVCFWFWKMGKKR